ncbi:hypothetical protein K8R04_04270 [Candidatus Uhrbacteria bacterium]|nr:hypothetical protein [Candidatus Uhrbacteria bacterium]
MKGPWFWVVGAVIAITLIGFHVTSHGEGYFEPAANVYLPLDAHATEEHCFEGTTRIVCERARTGFAVRGGTLRVRVTGISDLGIENGVHRADAIVQVSFDIDGHYDGWGWSRFDRPILYGAVTGARSVGEGSHRHVEAHGDPVLLEAIPPPYGGDTRYAPTLGGSCSTDTRHDLCRFRATVPITGDTNYLQIHLRERFR